ncbi:MAG: hypothetical protein D3916_11435 [Candidatus Electrothrix sp. MAN1_4]|nr:hypothetical protein [Candidatus Electrothrix sp. MAN1_4]
MKANNSKDEHTRLAANAMKRAAKKVLSRAVRENKPIPLWDGTKVVWKVPKKELEQMNAADGGTAADS